MFSTGERQTLQQYFFWERIKEVGWYGLQMLPWCISMFLAIQLITARHEKFKVQRELDELRSLTHQKMIGRAIQVQTKNLPEIGN
jgi:hypothetical protein